MKKEIKKDKGTMTSLLSKLKTETIPIVHRSPIAKLLRGSDRFAIYKLPFDDYGDLLIDQDGLDSLLETQEALETSYSHIFKEPDGCEMTDEQYEAYTEYLAIKAVREFIGV